MTCKGKNLQIGVVLVTLTLMLMPKRKSVEHLEFQSDNRLTFFRAIMMYLYRLVDDLVYSK